jgi:peptidoglycan/LPS O-acetylase OafA/YrhL
MRERVASLLRGLDLGWERTGLSRLVFLITCLALAALAQHDLDRRENPALAFVAYGLAALSFGFLFRHLGLEQGGRGEAGTRRRGEESPRLLLLIGLALGALSFPLFADNRFTPLGTLLWLSGLGLSLWALSFEQGSGGAEEQRSRGAGERRSRGVHPCSPAPRLPCPDPPLLVTPSPMHPGSSAPLPRVSPSPGRY